jgi:hypothetical protein
METALLPREYSDNNWDLEKVKATRLPDQMSRFLNAVEGKGFGLGAVFSDEELLLFSNIDQSNSAKTAEYLTFAKSLRIGLSWGKTAIAKEMADLRPNGLMTDSPFGLCIHLKREADKYTQFLSVADCEIGDGYVDWNIMQFQGQKMGKQTYNDIWAQLDSTSLFVRLHEQMALFLNNTDDPLLKLKLRNVDIELKSNDPQDMFYSTYKKALKFILKEPSYKVDDQNRKANTK